MTIHHFSFDMHHVSNQLNENIVVFCADIFFLVISRQNDNTKPNNLTSLNKNGHYIKDGPQQNFRFSSF